MTRNDRKEKLIREFSHLLAAGNIIGAIPADEKLCSFLYASLAGITGVIQCRICLFTENKPYGASLGEQCSGCTFFRDGGNCINHSRGNNLLFRLSTLSANYAFISVTTDDTFFEELVPAIQNLANITAISIENNIRNEELRKSNAELKNSKEELTIKVQERTRELCESNKELLKTVGILTEAQSIAKIGHWELDLYSRELFWSDEVYRIFELSPGKFIPTFNSFLDRIFPDDRPLLEKTFTEAIRTKSSYNIEHRIACSKKIKHVHEIGRIYYDEQGNAIKAIGMVLDISERKKNEKIINDNRTALEKQNKIYEKLNETLVEKNSQYEILVKQLQNANIKINSINEDLIISSEKAKESDRLKTAFLNNMSHEIRTPMNAIIGFSQLLPEKLSDREKIEAFVKIIIQRGNDLLRIVDDILDISKIESGLIPVTSESFSLKSFFDELQLVFSEEKLRYGKVHLTFSIVADETLKKTNIITDKLKLKQIFYNLIGNAFKFTEAGRIEAGCISSDEHGILFFVSDSGPGIVREKQDTIFNPFTQLEPESSRLYGGTGLGLSIVKGLVKLLGGNIRVESEPGKGSKFIFHINYSACLQNEQNRIENTRTPHSLLEDKKVLVVDDDEYNRLLVNEILEPTGINLLFAASGSDAIEIALEEKPDLILIDISLPDMQGYDVVKSIRKADPSIRFIAQTAYAGSFDRKKALSLGCIDHLGKPLKRNVLIEAVKKNLV